MKKTAVLLILLLGISGSSNARRLDFAFALDENCPNETPFGSWGKCVGCNDYRSLDIKEGHEKDFEICFNRKTIKEEETLSAKSILKECPLEAPMRSSLGACIPCDYSHFLWATEEECNKCPNRISSIDEVWSENYCELKECPPEAPLKDNHECLSCDRKGLILSVNQEMCQKCSETYEWYKGKCVPVLADNRYHSGPLIDLEYFLIIDESHFDQYVTHDCDVSDPILTTQRNCNQCSNREYKNGRCVLKQDIKQQNIHPKKEGFFTRIEWGNEISKTKE